MSSRPEVRVNMAMTLDGKVTRPDGTWHGMTSIFDSRRMDVYRRQADAIMVGKNSVSNDDPRVLPEHPHTNHDDRPPVPVMIARSSLPPAHLQMFRDERVRPILFTDRENDPAELRKFEGIADVVMRDRDDLHPAAVLRYLYDERGVRRLLLEGGPSVNHAFFSADLVDWLYLTLVPHLVGVRGLSGIVNGDTAFPGFDENRWELVSCEPERESDEIFLQYRRRR